MRPVSDFHDGLLQSMSFNVMRKEVVARVLAYETADSRTRSAFVLQFDDVISLSLVADVEELENNALSGQIVGLYLPTTDDTTRVSLTGGTIIIVSRSFRVDLDAGEPQGA